MCAGLDPESLRKLCQRCEYRSFLQQGNFVFLQQGERVDCCCLLLTGKLLVKVESTNGTGVHIGDVEENEHFGNEWLLLKALEVGDDDDDDASGRH